MTASTIEDRKASFAEMQARQEEQRQVKSSRVRCWGVALSHFVLAPVASIVYSAKTGKWTPTLVATGAAVVAVPVAAIDMGITLTFVPPITSAVMIINQVKEDRRRQAFTGPEEADMAYFSKTF